MRLNKKTGNATPLFHNKLVLIYSDVTDIRFGSSKRKNCVLIYRIRYTARLWNNLYNFHMVLK